MTLSTTDFQIQWQCQQLLNRAVTLTDAQSWDTLVQLYTEDAVLFRPSDATNGITGREQIKESFLARPPSTTCHLMTNCVFTVNNGTSVSATSRVLLMSGDATSEFPVRANSKILVGKFSDSLLLTNNEWLISRREGSIELRYDYLQND